jgi:predicted membrane protein
MGKTNTLFWGVILVLFGVLFLLDNFDIMNFSYFISTFWPVILILIGFKIILDKKRSESKNGESTSDSDQYQTKTPNNLSESNIFGDIIVKAPAENFSGGSVNNVFGEIRLDLSNIKLDQKLSKVYVSGVFGDINITTPKNIPIKVKANAVAGDIKILDESREGIFPSLDYSEEKYELAEKKYISKHPSFLVQLISTKLLSSR